MDKLYTVVEDGIVSCNACGAYTLDGNSGHIKHYATCGGVAEVEKWERYYELENESAEIKWREQ